MWDSGSSSSETLRPARAASIVIRTSQPNPAATREAVSARAAALRCRCPDSGSRASKPERARISVRAIVLAIPKPPPRRSANAAIARSSPLRTSGPRSPTRSASASTSAPAGAACSPSVSACPLPRLGSSSTRAPARSASAAVASREPSSATITSAPGNCSRSAATVAAIVRLLVACGDEDRGRVSHSAAASIGGTIPSSAPAFRP